MRSSFVVSQKKMNKEHTRGDRSHSYSLKLSHDISLIFFAAQYNVNKGKTWNRSSGTGHHSGQYKHQRKFMGNWTEETLFKGKHCIVERLKWWEVDSVLGLMR